MKVSDFVDMTQTAMADDGVYKTDSFVLELYNDGVRLVAAFTLYNERSTSVEVDGTRNYTYMPSYSGEDCLAPLYVSDMTTGVRINPTELEAFEFYQSQWEGVVDGSTPFYYTTTSRWSPDHAAMVFCPISDYGKSRFYFVGAYIPVEATASDTIDLDDSQLSAVEEYVKFMCFISEPGRADDALKHYKEFIARLELVMSAQDRRYPSGRDTEPVPVEFKQLSLVRYEQRKASDSEAKDEG